MTRLELLKERAQRYPYEKHAKKLKQADWDIIEQFISTHDHLNKGDFELAVNRMFIGKDKIKNYITILELLTVANCAKE